MNNASGVMESNGQMNVKAQDLNNEKGRMQGSGLAIESELMNNRGGKLLQSNKDRSLEIKSGSLNNASGVVGSVGKSNLSIGGDWRNDGELSSNGLMSVSVSGELSNAGKIEGGGGVEVNANTVNNEAVGKISSGGRTKIEAQNLNNLGLIDGVETWLQVSGVLRNYATTTDGGRIFGNTVRLGGGKLVNEGLVDVADGKGTVIKSPVIGSRGDMELGLREVHNLDGAQLLVLGKLNVGGALDANGKATGESELLRNGSAKVEVDGDAEVKAKKVVNENLHFGVELVVGESRSEKDWIVGGGIYRESEADWVAFEEKKSGLGVGRYYFYKDASEGKYKDPKWSEYYVRDAYQAAYTSCYGERCIDYPAEYDYGLDDRVWDDFGVERPKTKADRDAWISLQSKIDAFRNEIKNDVVKIYEHADYRTYTETRYDANVKYSKPSEFKVGGNLKIQAGETINDKSKLLVGGKLTVEGGALKNIGASVESKIERKGQYWRWQVVDSHGRINGDEYGWVPTDYSETRPYTVSDVGIGEVKENTAKDKGKVADKEAASAVESQNVNAPNIGKPNLSIPISSLYSTNPNPSASYLIETDPRFTNQQAWLSSDWMMKQLGVNPNYVQKRLGDGYYEQRLVQEQLNELTGRRFLNNESSNEAMYRSLMTNAVAFAQQFNLTPGVKLSAEQMKALTTDIVWLEEETITLKDGSTQKVLVPKVYLNPNRAILKNDGTLISASEIDVQVAGDVTNSGTIRGEKSVVLVGENVNNVGGSINGGLLWLEARKDINNIGGWIEGNEGVMLSAGRDVNIETTTKSSNTSVGLSNYSWSGVDQQAGVVSNKGTLWIEAGNNVNVKAGLIGNADKDGYTKIKAGNDVNFKTVQVGEQSNAVWDEQNYTKIGYTQEIGSQVVGLGDVSVEAGKDINMRATEMSVGKELVLDAKNDVNIKAGRATSNYSYSRFEESSGLLSSESTLEQEWNSSDTSIGSSVSADKITIKSGRDVTVEGSGVMGEHGLSVKAGRDINVKAAENYSTSGSYYEHHESGFSVDIGGGGVGASYNKTSLTQDNKDRQTSLTGSLLGSMSGTVDLNAGNNYTQTASDVMGKVVKIEGENVNIEGGKETMNAEQHMKMESWGIGVKVSTGLSEKASQMKDTYDQRGDAKSSNLKNWLVAQGVVQGSDAYDMYKDPKKGGMQPKVTVSLSHSESSSDDYQSGERVVSSTVSGENVSIKARSGDIRIAGSDVEASNELELDAKKKLTIESMQNRSEQRNRSDNSSQGVSYDFVSQSVGVNVGSGFSNGSMTSVEQVNSHVSGSKVKIKTGSDMTVAGGTVKADELEMDVGGKLTVESRQDTTTMQRDGKQTSVGVSAGGNVSGGFNVGTTEGNLDYANVREQSGIYVKDKLNGKVKGETELIGAVIDVKNKDGGSTFETERIISRDIENHMNASAESDNTGVDSSTATNGKYGAGMTLIGNSMNDGNETDSDRGKTSSAISSNIAISTTTNQDLSNVNRDTSNTNDQVRMGDLDGLAQDADEEARAGQTAYEVVKHEADAIKKAQAQGKDPSVFGLDMKCGNDKSLLECATQVKNPDELEKARDGKIHVANNGINNDLETAIKNAIQNMSATKIEYADGTTEEKTVPDKAYLVYSEKTEGMFGGLFTEMITALMQDWGFKTDPVNYNYKLLGKYGNDGIVFYEHSRGTLTGDTVRGDYLEDHGKGSALNVQVYYFGPAADVKKSDEKLAQLQNRDLMTEENRKRAELLYHNHIADPVGVWFVIGNNEPTGGTIPANSSILQEQLKALKGEKNTSHNCGGASKDKDCKPYWGGGVPVFRPASYKYNPNKSK